MDGFNNSLTSEGKGFSKADDSMDSTNNPYIIKDFEPRIYQQSIFSKATLKNTLVVLPTGLGKTNVFLMLAIHRLNKYPDSKILLFGPTKPLVEQYMTVFLKNTNIKEDEIAILTGRVSPDKRMELWKKSKIIFSTPQGFENDLLGKKISLKDVSLTGFDECHRATGSYSYVWIAKKYSEEANHQLVVGLTASPGSNTEKIKEVCQNLHIEQVEMRSYEDLDVKEYVKEIDIKWIVVNLPEEYIKIRDHLKAVVKKRLDKAKSFGLLREFSSASLSKKSILEAQAKVLKNLSSGDKSPVNYSLLSILAEIIKIEHAIELIETQDVYTLKTYFERLHSDALKGTSKAVKNIVIDPDFKSASYITELLSEKKENHPKIEKLKELLFKEVLDKGLTESSQKEQKDYQKKAIIFTQYRDSAKRIHEVLSQIRGLKPMIFVGQAKRSEIGLSQKEQKKVIEDFKSGEINLLISTSVGEEGLDIPAVDLVVFYEPVPSAIRHIQRRGRTGRQEKGKVFVLLAKNTRDEAYRWSSFHKEKGMKKILYDIEKSGDFLNSNDRNNEKNSQSGLNSIKNQDLFNTSNKPKIFVDFREKASDILKELDSNGIVELELSKLNVGDFILSERVGVEFKNSRDFVNSIIDGRLLPQIRDLKENYLKPVLIIQGEDIFSQANIHENSIRGIIIAITVGFGVPIIFSKDAKETAKYVQTIALRENMQKLRETSPHGNRKQMALKEAQRYIVSAIPGVGPALSDPILKRFKTIKNIANAKEEDFLEIEKVGQKKASSIFEIFNEEYE